MREETVTEEAPDLHRIVQEEAQRMQDVLPIEMASKCPIISLMRKGWFPEGMGDQITTEVHERADNAVTYSTSRYSYQIDQIIVKSDSICLGGLRGLDVETSIKTFGLALEGVLEERFTDLYYKYAEIGECGQIGIADVLETKGKEIIRNGGKRDDEKLTALMGVDSLTKLSESGSPLSEWGFCHIPWPRRYNAQGDRVYPFWNGSDREEINSDYLNAATEDAIIFHRDAMECLMIKPEGFEKPADQFLATIKWVPTDGDAGYFEAYIANAGKPIRPRFATILRYSR